MSKNFKLVPVMCVWLYCDSFIHLSSTSLICFVSSLVARILWRHDKEGTVMSDMQLTTLEELEDHIADMQEDDLQEFKVDIHNFLDYWPRTSKQHTIDDISHLFGVVRFIPSFPSCVLKIYFHKILVISDTSGC